MMQGHRPGGKGSCGVEQATQGSPEPPEGARLADTLTSALRPISHFSPAGLPFMLFNHKLVGFVRAATAK